MALFSCYPEKDISWGFWCAGDSKKSAQMERQAALAALERLKPCKLDLTNESVVGEKLVGYLVQDHFNLYTPEQFASAKQIEANDVGIAANIRLSDPYSQEPKDFIMVRQNKPLELVQVSIAGTKMTSDLIPYLVRDGQAAAQFHRSSGQEVEARGMTAYKQRTVLSE